MMTRHRIGIATVVLALLMPVAAIAALLVTPARVNGICRSDFAVATTWSRSVPAIESDTEMAAWERGVAGYLGLTGTHLRAVGAPPLATEFNRVAAGHRNVAVAYLSGSFARVNAADLQLRTASTHAMNVARAAKAPACVAYVKNYRP
jgi:hypothetical protein